MEERGGVKLVLRLLQIGLIFFGNAHRGVGMVHKCFKISKSVMCQSLEIFGTREIGFLSIS
jgi:hypothetical protein